MTAYNAEKTIAEAIESVLKQSFPDFEFIIVSDGLTDNIRSIISSYDDKRIRLVGGDQDQIQSINSGIKASTGKFIAFMDADSLMHVDRLKIQHSMMEEFPEITICSSWETVFGKNIPQRITRQKISGWMEFPLAQLLIEDITVNHAYMVRRSFIETHVLLYKNCERAENFKFWVEIAKLNGGFYIDSQPLVYRRIDDTKISGKHRLEKLQSISKIKKEILYFLCNKFQETYPALVSLCNSYYELLDQKLVSEDDILTLFHSLFIKNKDSFNNLENNQTVKKQRL
jgi:glycosyltransferase involved in cell wall biosynthesis